jgi:protein kinase A
MDERRMLHAVRHNNLVHLEFIFKDNVYIHLGLPFINGGDFFSHLCDHNVVEESEAKFFAGQIFLGLEYLHMHNVAYRDLKPENILMDINGYLKVTDVHSKRALSFEWLTNVMSFTLADH